MQACLLARASTATEGTGYKAVKRQLTPRPACPLHAPRSADIGRLEAGWAQRWREQADSTADLRGRLERMAAASDGQSQEVAGRLQVGVVVRGCKEGWPAGLVVPS